MVHGQTWQGLRLDFCWYSSGNKRTAKMGFGSHQRTFHTRDKAALASASQPPNSRWKLLLFLFSWWNVGCLYIHWVVHNKRKPSVKKCDARLRSKTVSLCNHCWNVRSTCYSTTHILAAPTITKLEGEKGAMLFMQHWIKAVNPIKHLPGPAVCIKLKRGNYHLCILGNKYRLLTIRGDLQPSAFFK